MKKGESKFLVYGLRRKLGITQKELGKLVGSPRRTTGQYEDASRYPGKEKLQKFLDITKKNKFNVSELIIHGKEHFGEVEKREQSKTQKLSHSKDLAELTGILLGDGCIQRTCIIIALNKKLDKDFAERRVKKLIYKLCKCNLSTTLRKYEDTLEIRAYSRPFIKFLEEKFGWKPGNKIRNQTTIPKWCFKKKEYLSHVLRGYFDTDGYLEIRDNSPIVRIRFSNKCKKLIEDMSNALKLINIKFSLQWDKIGAELRVYSRKEVLKFFKIIGSSNVRNISSFISWRYKKGKNAKELETISLPFLWKESNSPFKDKIKEDNMLLRNWKIKETFKWNEITAQLLEKNTHKALAKTLKMGDRSIREWREGRNNPSIEKIPLLLRVIKKQKIDLNNYRKCQQG